LTSAQATSEPVRSQASGPKANIEDPLLTAATTTAALPKDSAPRTNRSAARIEPQPLAKLAAPQPSRVDGPRRTTAPGGTPDAGIRVPKTALPRPPTPRTASAPQLAITATSPEVYSTRFGAKKAEALDKFGGTAQTERAVQQGLRYLASIQNGDGSWGSKRKFHRKYGEVFVGKTGLCLLAFLGAGHTPASETEHTDVVRRAIKFLLESQEPESGHFGISSAYSHGISTYALAECYALTSDRSLRRPLQRAVAWIVAQQNTTRNPRNRGGWGYYSPRLEPEDNYARASVTAWQVMALESARLSGLDVADEVLAEAKRFLLNCWDGRNGYFLYNHEPSRLSSSWRTLPASTPASVFCLLLLGTAVDDDRIQQGLRYTTSRAPRAYRRYSDEDFVRQAKGNVYFWYYGSLACFLAGGDA
jgi:hypothetical protein